MKYSVSWLKNEIEQNKKVKYLFFWGHQPSKDGSITSSCFSQWWLSEFVVDGIKYKSAEHFMMASKARLFNDEETLKKILNCNKPAEAKKLGREVKNFNEEAWISKRYEIVLQASLNKFSQNNELKEYLIRTSVVIVEASPVDSIWGIGMAKDHKDIENPEKWKGLNLLGFALMEARDQLSTSHA